MIIFASLTSCNVNIDDRCELRSKENSLARISTPCELAGELGGSYLSVRAREITLNWCVRSFLMSHEFANCSAIGLRHVFDVQTNMMRWGIIIGSGAALILQLNMAVASL